MMRNPSLTCMALLTLAAVLTGSAFGDDPEKLPPFVQFSGNGSPQRLYRVGRKKPNQFGLYDTLGGVYEWCTDWYGEDYYECSPLDDPLGPVAPKAVYWPHGLPLLDPGLDREREVRVLRGGAFNFESPLLLRCAHRIGLGTTGGHWHLGFRAAMSVCSDGADAVRESSVKHKVNYLLVWYQDAVKATPGSKNYDPEWQAAIERAAASLKPGPAGGPPR